MAYIFKVLLRGSSSYYEHKEKVTLDTGDEIDTEFLNFKEKFLRIINYLSNVMKLKLKVISEVYDRKNTRNVTRELMREAKKEIIISTYVFEWIDDIKDVLIQKIKEGVEIKVFMTNPESKYILSPNDKKLAEKSLKTLKELGCKVYLLNKRLPFRGVIIDDKKLLCIGFQYTEERAFDKSEEYTIIESESQVLTYKDYISSIEEEQKLIGKTKELYSKISKLLHYSPSSISPFSQ